MLGETQFLLQIRQELQPNHPHPHFHVCLLGKREFTSPILQPLSSVSRAVSDLTTLAVRLSHTGIISAPASEAYGNVTGRRWTRWMLTHSHPPTGRPPRSTSATMGRLVGVKQKAGLTDKHSLTHTHIYVYIYIHTVCWILKFLFQKLLM